MFINIGMKLMIRNRPRDSILSNISLLSWQLYNYCIEEENVQLFHFLQNRNRI